MPPITFDQNLLFSVARGARRRQERGSVAEPSSAGERGDVECGTGVLFFLRSHSPDKREGRRAHGQAGWTARVKARRDASRLVLCYGFQQRSPRVGTSLAGGRRRTRCTQNAVTCLSSLRHVARDGVTCGGATRRATWYARDGVGVRVVAGPSRPGPTQKDEQRRARRPPRPRTGAGGRAHREFSGPVNGGFGGRGEYSRTTHPSLARMAGAGGGKARAVGAIGWTRRAAAALGDPKHASDPAPRSRRAAGSHEPLWQRGKNAVIVAQGRANQIVRRGWLPCGRQPASFQRCLSAK